MEADHKLDEHAVHAGAVEQALRHFNIAEVTFEVENRECKLINGIPM